MLPQITKIITNRDDSNLMPCGSKIYALHYYVYLQCRMKVLIKLPFLPTIQHISTIDGTVSDTDGSEGVWEWGRMEQAGESGER